MKTRDKVTTFNYSAYIMGFSEALSKSYHYFVIYIITTMFIHINHVISFLGFVKILKTWLL